MKGIIGFAAGLVVGSVGGYFVARFKLKKHFQAELDSEIDAIKDTKEELRKRKERKEEQEKAKQILEEYGGDTEKFEEQDDVLEESDSVEIGGEDDDIGEFEADTDYYSGLKDIMKKEGRPYNITAEEFEDNKSGFDKCYITYNEATETVSDNQTGMVLDDGWYNIGGDSGCVDDDRCYSDGFFYVRNERISTDFCIDKCSVV